MNFRKQVSCFQPIFILANLSPQNRYRLQNNVSTCNFTQSMFWNSFTIDILGYCWWFLIFATIIIIPHILGLINYGSKMNVGNEAVGRLGWTSFQVFLSVLKISPRNHWFYLSSNVIWCTWERAKQKQQKLGKWKTNWKLLVNKILRLYNFIHV